MAVIVKRYPNRKLYNTETKKYITLDGIASLIRTGNEVQIIDHNSGEDLTTLTLSQIIFEQEKKRSGFIPKAVLTSLIQAGGETLETLRRGLTNPLEMLTPVEQEIDQRLQVLVHHGEIAREEMLRLREQLFRFSILDLRPKKEEARVELPVEVIENPTTESSTAIQGELDMLRTQLDALTQRFNKLTQQSEDAAT